MGNGVTSASLKNTGVRYWVGSGVATDITIHYTTKAAIIWSTGETTSVTCVAAAVSRNSASAKTQPCVIVRLPRTKPFR